MKKYAVLWMMFLGIILGCEKEKPMVFQLDSELKTALENVKRVRIFFGHQSVGSNILSGIKEIENQSGGAKINFIEKGKGNIPADGFFAHGKIGKNESPESKCEAVKNILRSGLGNHVDVVLFKFCFIDIRRKDDEKAILGAYKDTLAMLRSEFPGVKFIPITVPLTVNEKSWKYMIKKILKMETEKDHNNKRNEFNRLLKETFKGEAIFDLAEIESRRENGSREEFKLGENTYYSLVPEYSSDGSHLNDYGSKMVGKELILFLGRLIPEKEKSVG